MQRVLHDGRSFWTIQLNYIREELARTVIILTCIHTYGYAYSLQKEYCLREVHTDCYGHTAITTVTTATTTTTTSGYCDFIPVCYVLNTGII